MVKNLPADAGEAGLIPGSERTAGVGNDSPLQCSCLENTVSRGACRAAVRGITESDGTEQLSMRAHTEYTDAL